MASENDERKPQVDINIGLGGLFKNLGDLVNNIADLMAQAEQAGGEIRRSGTISNDPESKLRGVYGFSIRSGIGGKPRVEPFGNLRATERGPEMAEIREPLVDVFDEGEELLVLAELPGADETTIKVELHGDILALEAGGTRRYAKEVLLPAAADPASLQRSYRNGILEVRVKRA
ncbi:MAG: Hsp20/alpha crystallin family protein [Oscillochloris sp.]|nr:Hsp20/alpha crystallin family protein [Oscillochloris sp.]